MSQHLLDLHGVVGRPPQVGGELAAERVRRPSGRVLHDPVDGVVTYVAVMFAGEEVSFRQGGHDPPELVAQRDDAVLASLAVDDDAFARQIVDDVARMHRGELGSA